MSQPKRKSQYRDKENLASRYMSSTKKRYYLASVDENINLLTKEQANELTTILIQLKSEYDSLVKEKNITERKTDELCKKMILLERMDKKAKDKNDEANSNNEMIKEAIDIKKQQLTEEAYTKKTLENKIFQLKNDIFISRKELTFKEENGRNLKARYQKEKLIQNEIREKKNSVFNRISQQKRKNQFEKNEYDLQLHFYHTMINQKWAFIQSADERRDRQRKIAQDAKNDTQDKQEIIKRRLLGLFHLFDKYLQCKMEEVNGESFDLEESFQKIKDICGTSNLQIMVDKIITKDKRYNANVCKVIEQEQKIKDLNDDIFILKNEFDELKSHSKPIIFILLITINSISIN